MEQVVLVDDDDNEIGTAEKATVHTSNTPLHRGFSLFLFNSKGELLLTRRSKTKKTFPGVWTNTVCGHPRPGESAIEAAIRRLRDELGIEIEASKIREVAPYRYRYADQNGIVENEICPVLMTQADVDPVPNKHEVVDWKWINWQEFIYEVKKHPQKYSPWSVDEAGIINKLKKAL